MGAQFAKFSKNGRPKIAKFADRSHTAPENTLAAFEAASAWLQDFFCFLNNLSELRILTTFYSAKNDHRWVTFIFLKTIYRNSFTAACP